MTFFLLLLPMILAILVAGGILVSLYLRDKNNRANKLSENQNKDFVSEYSLINEYDGFEYATGSVFCADEERVDNEELNGDLFENKLREVISKHYEHN